MGTFSPYASDHTARSAYLRQVLPSKPGVSFVVETELRLRCQGVSQRPETALFLQFLCARYNRVSRHLYSVAPLLDCHKESNQLQQFLAAKFLSGLCSEIKYNAILAYASTMSNSNVDEEVVEILSQSQQQSAVGRLDYRREAKDKYAFWETQPVVQFTEAAAQGQEGPIDPIKTVQEVRQEPYNLPDSFEWCTCNLADDAAVHEVYELLSNNYVEDGDNLFRFCYSSAFLRWALQPPGFQIDWLLGVRVKATRKLVGFISAIPADIRADTKVVRMVEINFLCVHKKLRAKRLAPVLIKEITRRVNLHNIWQAAYTAGTVIPKPFATCRYWHRPLNPKKLIDVKFSRLAPRMTMARTIKLYKLPDTTVTPGIRAFEPRDVPAVAQLLNEYLGKFRVAQVYNEEEVAHWFTPQDLVINAYVVEDPATGKITDLVSFYTLPSTLLGHPEHSELRAAYMYYTVPTATPLKQLLNDVMIFARSRGYDVFNALDLLQNSEVLRDLKFGIGDGQLHYYLYNWRLTSPLAANEVGLILM